MPETKPTTSSPETQELIDLCLAIAGGDEDQKELLATRVAERREAMNEAMDRFFGQAEEQGEEFQQQFRSELDEIEARFRDFEATLERLETVLEEGGEAEDEYQHAAAALGWCSNALYAATGRYEEHYMSSGPSKFPIVNLFDNLGQGLREGTTPTKVWDSTCQWYIDFYTKAVEEVDASEHKQDPGVPERREVMTRIIGLLAELAEKKPGDPADAFTSLLAEMTSAHLDLEKAFNTYSQHVFSEGPTDAPAINRVLNITRGFLEGKYVASTLRTVVQEHLENVRNSLDALQPILASPPESTVLNEELAEILEGAEEIEDALKVLLELADDPEMDADEVESAIATLETSGNKVAAAAKAVNSYNETAGKVICVHCHTENPPGARVCAGCERALPQFDVGARSSFQVLEGAKAGPDFNQETVTTENMKALYEKCESLGRGEISRDAFLAYLDARENELDAAEEKLRPLKPPAMPDNIPEGGDLEAAQQAIDLAEDVLDLAHLGLDECRQGLDRMRMSAQDDDPELMQQGQALYYNGIQKLWQIWRTDHVMQSYLHGEPLAVEETVDLSSTANGSPSTP